MAENGLGEEGWGLTCLYYSSALGPEPHDMPGAKWNACMTSLSV